MLTPEITRSHNHSTRHAARNGRALVAAASAATLLALACSSPASAGNPAQCAAYANQAVIQQGRNLENSCGFSGARWGSNFGAHLAWCLSASNAAIEAERNARAAQLATCTGGGGGGGGVPRACVWDLPNYQGDQVCVNAGMSDSNVAPAWNDRVSSLKTYNGAKIRLCQNPGYLGFCNTFQGNVPMLGNSLNNKASSYQVFE